MMDRRHLIAGLVASGMLASPAPAHTLYGQWLVYRKKHLLIGCHRKDALTFQLALDLVDEINHAYPDAKARPARAPHPQRLASLLGTDQMEVAVVSVDDAMAMTAGVGPFAPYGRLSLRSLARFGDHLMVADAAFPDRHAWMLTNALSSAAPDAVAASAPLARHAGAVAFLSGGALETIAD